MTTLVWGRACTACLMIVSLRLVDATAASSEKSFGRLWSGSDIRAIRFVRVISRPPSIAVLQHRASGCLPGSLNVV